MTDPCQDNCQQTGECSIPEMELIGNTLFGAGGGQLEYAGQKLVVRETGRASVILYFTDHDKWGCGEPSICEDIYSHYAIEVPVSFYGV